MIRPFNRAMVLPAMSVGVLLLACLAHPYTAAVAAMTAPPPGDQVSAGKQVFERWCVHCHGDGPRYPGTASLKAKYGNAAPAALEERQDLSSEVVALFVRHGVSTMAPFRKTEITDAELAALGAYLSHQSGATKRGQSAAVKSGNGSRQNATTKP